MTNNPNSPIEGIVVAPLGNREVLINRGPEHGVEIGMRFVILGEQIDVPIPESDETVPIRQPKTIVKIVRFEGPRASVGRTFRTIKGSPGIASVASLTQGTPDRLETFSVDPFDKVDANHDKTIHKGDLVRQTVGEEYI